MSNKKILLNRRHNTFQKISGRSRKSDGSYGVHCMKEQTEVVMYMHTH